MRDHILGYLARPVVRMTRRDRCILTLFAFITLC